MPLPFITNPEYTDNGVPLGAIIATDLKKGTQAGATTVITGAILENWTFNTPANVITRPDQIGGPNGWAAVGTQPTASGTIQIPSVTAGAGNLELPKVGHWFSYTRDFKSGATAEIWVLTSVGDVRDYGTYMKVTCSAHLAYNPA